MTTDNWCADQQYRRESTTAEKDLWGKAQGEKLHLYPSTHQIPALTILAANYLPSAYPAAHLSLPTTQVVLSKKNVFN